MPACSRPARCASGRPSSSTTTSSSGSPPSTISPSTTERSSRKRPAGDAAEQRGDRGRQGAREPADACGVGARECREVAREPSGVGAAAGVQHATRDAQAQRVRGRLLGALAHPRAEAVGEGERREQQRERAEQQDERACVAGSDRLVDDDADEQRHGRLAHLVDAEQRGRRRDGAAPVAQHVAGHGTAAHVATRRPAPRHSTSSGVLRCFQ